MSHIDEGQLHALLDNALEPGAADTVRQHAAACAECAVRLEQERGIRARAIAILDLARPRTASIPPFETVLQRAAQPSPERFRMPGPTRLAWAATVILALGIGWLGRDFAPRGDAIDAIESTQLAEPVVDASAPVPVPTVPPPPEPAKETRAPTGAVAGAASSAIKTEESLRRDRVPAAASASADLMSKTIAQNAQANSVVVAQRSQFGRDSALALQELVVTGQQQAARGAAQQQGARGGGGRGGIGAVAASPPASAPQSVPWEFMDLAQAEQRIGRTVLVIPGLAVDSVGLLQMQGAYRVRMIQRIPGDGVIEIEQSPAPPRQERMREDAQPLSSRADPAGFFTVTVPRLDVLLTGRARLQPDSIRALLQRAR